MEITPEQFEQHMVEDKAFQGEQRSINVSAAVFQAEMEGSLVTLHEKLETLATKYDIEEIKDFMKNVNVGLGIFRFSWNNASKIGSFVLMIGACILFFKYGLLGIISYLFSTKP